VIAPGAGAERGALPARLAVEGVARLAPRARVFDRHTVFAGGRPVVRSRLGSHAVVVADRLLAVGADLAERWGRLSALWALNPIEDFLVETLDRPLLKLPPVGAIRLDDAPGTAQIQIEDRDKGDDVAARRLARLRASFRDVGATLSVAVAARGLADGEPVPAERVWPRGIAEIAAAVEEGTFEPIAHGWLHFDPDAPVPPGRGAEPREFARLSEAEAGERIDAAVAWQRETLGGDPRTFVAPAWGYSDGALRALSARSLPAWHRAAPAPLLMDGNPRETLIGPGGRGGVFRLDYDSLVRMASAGLPPTPALHGGLMDDRLEVRVLRDAWGYARLMRKRDAQRLPAIQGVRWIGARALFDLYAAHDVARVDGRDAVLESGGEGVLRDRDGERAVRR
jgi:hypothetical protein